MELIHTDQPTKPLILADPNADPYAYLGIAPNLDGSITRVVELPTTPASSDPSNPFHVSKDMPINPSKGTFARIFVPREALDSSPAKKLPLIVYFHGGGFVVSGLDSATLDSLYPTLVAGTPAVVVSVGYRLAPEYRLPAAYDDCEEGLRWIKTCRDEWLTCYADFSRCFLLGTSAGGNISYHVGLRAAACADDLMPLRIRGLILHHAFFGGTKRSGSELRLSNDKVIPVRCSDLLWELCLPIGADRDHEYSNPMMGIKPGQFDLFRSLGWKILVTGCDGDPLVDRQIGLAKLLEENGLSVVGKFDKGGCHACDLSDPARAEVLSMNLKEFIGLGIDS